jgi:hypothetical protein
MALKRGKSMPESKRRLFHYRKATFFQIVGRTLQELLEEALQKCTPVGKRFQPQNIEGDETWKLFINTHRSALGMEFGNLVLYAPDQNRHIITEDQEKDELDIQQIGPPAHEDGKKRQFLDSILYYGVSGNHVILLQSVALRSRNLESYFNWLLREAGLVDDSNLVFLNNFAPPITHEKLEGSEVKSVRIGTPLADVGIPETVGAVPADTSEIRFRPKGQGLELLRVMMPERMKELRWSDLSESSNLEIFVEVTYKRQTDPTSQKVLNQITSSLRNLNDDDVRIVLKNGLTIIGSELQVKNYFNIDTYGGLVDPTDVFKKMQAWLIDIIETGLIEPE